MRRWRDLWSVTRPGGATAAESVEPEAVRSGTNVAEFADFLLGFALLDVMGDDGEKRPPTIPALPVRGG